MQQYDVLILGAGPGGYVTAIRAAQLGLKVAVVENREVGGTCLNRGCIPTKTLLHTAMVYEQLQQGDIIGLKVEGISCDYEALYQRKEQVTKQLRTGIEGLFKANGIDSYVGQGMVMEAGKVKVTKGEEETILSGKSIVIATGSRPAMPPIEGRETPGVLTSDDLLEKKMESLKSLIIVGGGVIGVEFAHIYQSLGCKVTIVEALDRLLPQMDGEISQNLAMLFKRARSQVHTGARVLAIGQGQDNLTVTIEAKGKEQVLEAEAVLIATGRKPNIEGVWADGLAIGTERGHIVIDDHCQTNVAGIYAIGDVTAGIQLAHRASAQGLALAEYLAGHTPNMDLSVIPSCIYSNPEIASVGLTEEEAKGAGKSVVVGKFSMLANGKSLIEQEKRGFVKLVFDRDSQVLLGAQLMCGRATDLIGELATAVVNGLTRQQLSKVVRAHPTFGEAIGEAIDDCGLGAIHAAPKRK